MRAVEPSPRGSADLERQPEQELDGRRGLRHLEPRRVGFFLPPFDKSALFPTVATRGVLPRKAFSLGEAEEKRFYLEARKLE